MNRDRGWRWGLTAFVMGAVLLAMTGWWHIQALRLAYSAQRLHRELDELDQQERKLDEELQQALALPRLDQWARERLGFTPPKPDQVIVIEEGL